MRTIALDCETHKFRPGRMLPPVVSVAWAEDDAAGVLLAGEAEEYLLDLLREAMLGRACIVGHSTSYDLGCISEHFPKMSGFVWAAYDAHAVQCTCAREKLLDAARGMRTGTNRESYSLAAVAKRRFGLVLDKDPEVRLNYDQLDGVEVKYWPERFLEYALADVVVTLRTYLAQEADARIFYPGFLDEAARQAAFDFALRLTSARGLMVDRKRLEIESAALRPEMEAALEVMRRHGLTKSWEDDKKNRKAVQKIVEQCLGENAPRTPASEKFPAGQIQADKDALLRCDHPAVHAWLTYSGHERTLHTFLRPLDDAGEFPVHASFDVLGSEAGRTSSFNPNFQNLPRKGGVRECVVPRPGYCFAVADYDAQEMRTLAESCLVLLGKSRLAQRFIEDPEFDPHSDFAAALQGISYEEGVRRRLTGDEKFKADREMTKAANFGLPTGMSAEKFVAHCRQRGVNISVEKSTALKKRWLDQWPEMKDYFKHCAHVEHSGGKFIGLVSGYIRGGCRFTQVANGYFQNLAGSASKNGLYLVAKRCFDDDTSALYGCRPVWYVHDEVGIEAPLDYAHEAAEALRDTLEEGMEEVCARVPARASMCLMDRWSKRAKPVFVEGRLVPWSENPATT